MLFDIKSYFRRWQIYQRSAISRLSMFVRWIHSQEGFFRLFGWVFVSMMLEINPLKGFSSWEGRNGVVNTYWSGARNASDTGCQCSQDGTCAKSAMFEPICNCDTVGAELVDVGILTDKESLPVKSLQYGGAMTQFSSIKYILGSLTCSGKAKVSLHHWIISYHFFFPLIYSHSFENF